MEQLEGERQEKHTLSQNLGRLLLRYPLNLLQNPPRRVRHRLHRVEPAVHDELDVTLGQSGDALDSKMVLAFVTCSPPPFMGVVPPVPSAAWARQDRQRHRRPHRRPSGPRRTLRSWRRQNSNQIRQFGWKRNLKREDADDAEMDVSGMSRRTANSR